MELFFFILLSIISTACFLYTSERPNAFANMVLFLGLFVIALSLYQSGLTIPNTSAVTVGGTTTFQGTNYTMDNNPIILGMFWSLFSLGIIGIGLTIDAMLKGKIQRNGAFR